MEPEQAGRSGPLGGVRGASFVARRLAPAPGPDRTDPVIVLETLGRRWFAFAFIAGLLWAAWPEGGWRRALRFLVIAFGVSLLAEYSSTHNGFPYGRYGYIAHTRGDELYISNIPLFVPLSFGTMVWGARALAIVGLSGLSQDARRRVSLPLLAAAGAISAAVLDLIVDPMSLRGGTWFMGDLFAYRHGSWYFGVPWSNFAGWMLASAVIVAIDGALGRTDPPPGLVRSPAMTRSLILAFGTCVFQVGLALATSHWAIAGATAAITLALAGVTAGSLRRRRMPLAPPSAEPPDGGVREPRRPAPAQGSGAALADEA